MSDEKRADTHFQNLRLTSPKASDAMVYRKMSEELENSSRWSLDIRNHSDADGKTREKVIRPAVDKIIYASRAAVGRAGS